MAAVVSCRGQTEFEPHPDWSPLGGQFKFPDEHYWVPPSPPLPQAYIINWAEGIHCTYSLVYSLAVLLEDYFPLYPGPWTMLTQGQQTDKAQKKNKVRTDILTQWYANVHKT